MPNVSSDQATPSFAAIGAEALFRLDVLIIGATIVPGLLMMLPGVLFLALPAIVLATLVAAVALLVGLGIAAFLGLRAAAYAARSRILPAPDPAAAGRLDAGPRVLSHETRQIAG